MATSGVAVVDEHEVMTRRLRTGLNGIIVVVSLVVALPQVVVAERICTGAGRMLALAVIRALSQACGIRFRVVGADRLASVGDRPCVLVANHSSPVDIPALLIACPTARFVAAAELFGIPLLGSAIRALGSVPVDRRKRAQSASLDTGGEVAGPIVVFAEGGIPEPGVEPRFETGAFVLAIRTGAPVVPITIRGSADVLPRGSRVWARPGTIIVEFHDPIETTGLALADRKGLRDRTERAVRSSS